MTNIEKKKPAKRTRERHAWTDDEDNLLMNLIKLYGAQRWSLISKFIEGRSGKQCHNRWSYTLNPNMRRGVWTEEEDIMIVDLYKKHGKHWTKVSTN